MFWFLYKIFEIFLFFLLFPSNNFFQICPIIYFTIMWIEILRSKLLESFSISNIIFFSIIDFKRPLVIQGFSHVNFLLLLVLPVVWAFTLYLKFDVILQIIFIINIYSYFRLKTFPKVYRNCVVFHLNNDGLFINYLFK